MARAHAGLAAAGVPANVAPMQAYLKTTEPFFGVKAPARKAVLRSMADLPLKTNAQVHAVVAGLWALPEREARYLAIDLARKHRKAIVLDALPLYERMVREGAWWDLADPIAVHLVGALWMAEPDAVTPVMDRWIEDPHLWIRRTALLAQLRHKGGPTPAGCSRGVRRAPRSGTSLCARRSAGRCGSTDAPIPMRSGRSWTARVTGCRA